MIVSFDSIKDSLINHPCKIPNDVRLNFQAVLELYSSTMSSNFNLIFIPLSSCAGIVFLHNTIDEN